jgi:hypothetical protein
MKTGANSPHISKYYLERAEACERLAGEAATEEKQQILLELAARWRALAAEDGSPPCKG